MKEQFTPYKQALELKKLGFGLSDDDYIVLSSFYNSDKEFINNEIGIKHKNKTYQIGAYTINDFEPYLIEVDNSLDDIVLAPTFQQAFDWFREKHKLDLYYIEPTTDSHGLKCYGVLALKTVIFNGRFDTYEEARLACLEKLIEIVKTKY
jgi:hypothetical protein